MCPIRFLFLITLLSYSISKQLTLWLTLALTDKTPVPPQLDSATSLIQAAKNLMNAVVLTVKCSYVASTKYPRQGTIPVSILGVLCSG